MPTTDPRVIAAYEEALFTIARATVQTRQKVRGFTVDQDAARELLVTCEQALTALVALGAVPGRPEPVRALIGADCPYTHAHTRNWCGYPQCREA